MTAELNDAQALTPAQVVAELDKFIVGQQAAKRAVAIALRNRWRRQRVAAHLRDEVTPKNIILVGPTGVGKTEIARRLAKLVQAPFIKVEATKFTEVGYVGRDVDAIVRDLVEVAVQLVREGAQAGVQAQAADLAETRLLDILLPRSRSAPGPVVGFAGPGDEGREAESRARLRAMLRAGELSSREVEIELEAQRPASMPAGAAGQLEDMGAQMQQFLGQVMGSRRLKTKMRVDEALLRLTQEEAQKLVDHSGVHEAGVRLAENSGIVFIDEIDKIARRGEGGSQGPDVSREGVQRDILPLVEGTTVQTKYGPVRTDHVLFIAAGAFHVAKVSDLIPELQGRFPIRVELEALGEAELLRILQEPQNALPVQYTALLATERVKLTFTETGLRELARIAAEANARSENIGARRLHTVFERLLEDISFTAPERADSEVHIDAADVRDRLSGLLKSEDLGRYIL